eukprot:CAMPEP_0205827930 /NCGR_PEP_ID=MMETSP0206-20130828/33562_1 /ASSEMBLY_ACC=CAM_ASM_000279 /TAXON_ID=36767 /ORGANISM="Euplotes focardii, Strain TN1" /LENGTH=318 /DNA_ID=CAMNT_0053129275 /DNA_START=598 /DNA_END=1554 /DNA_ORIENTATION=+
MKLTQKVEHIERETEGIIHDIGSIPSGPLEKTRQEELEELNEFDNIDYKTVNKYIKKVDHKINDHSDEISEAYEAMQDRLRDHFRIFAESVREKFEREVIHSGIKQEFEKLSPIKNRDDYDEDFIETGEDSRLSGIDETEERPGNDGCLSPDMKQLKSHLVKAYTNPLEEYQTSINTTAEFGKNLRLQNDLKYMSMKQRHEKSERSASVEQKQKREKMKKRLGASKMRKTTTSYDESPMDVVKSARLWNAFDSTDPYPNQKYTTNVSSPSVAHSLTPSNKNEKGSLNKTKSASIYGEQKVRRKKDELVKTLLFSNRNR